MSTWKRSDGLFVEKVSNLIELIKYGDLDTALTDVRLRGEYFFLIVKNF